MEIKIANTVFGLLVMIFLLTLVLVVPACGEKGDQNGQTTADGGEEPTEDGGKEDGGGDCQGETCLDSCQDDSECASGYCNPDTKKCGQAPAQCKSDEDCQKEDKKGCNTEIGICQWECTIDSHCKDGYCDFVKKNCAQGERKCQSDADCKSKPKKGCDTLTGQCKYDCTVDAHCPGGKCHPYERVCLYGKKCLSDEDCQNMSHPGCNPKSGHCEWECTESKHCISGKCDLANHTCVEPKACKKDDDCKGEPKEGCEPEKGLCTWECSDDSVCQDGICNLVLHLCQKEVFCQKEDDCQKEKNKSCNTARGLCEWECSEDTQCTSGKCNIVNHSCQIAKGCTSNLDCQSEPRLACDVDNSLCQWECTATHHCPSGNCDTVSHTCHTAKSCQNNNDCQGETRPACNTFTDRCEWECSENEHCDTKKCNYFSHKCRKSDGCQSCNPDEFCFNQEICTPKWKTCSYSTQCSKEQQCHSVGKSYCLDQCKLVANYSTEISYNPYCFDGLGLCIEYSTYEKSNGVCILPRDNLHQLLDKCNGMDPALPEWHSCQSDLVCVKTSSYSKKAFCYKKCDPKKNDANELNPDCESGKGKCSDRQMSSGGFCEVLHEKNRKSEEKCLSGNDHTLPEYHDCETGLLCFNNKCVIERTATCKESEKCLGNTPGATDWCECQAGLSCVKNTCTPERTFTQKEDQGCETYNFDQPDYNSCTSNLTCHDNICSKSCDPSVEPDECDQDHICSKKESDSTTQGVCKPINLKTCSQYNKCAKDYFCFNFYQSPYLSSSYPRCVMPCDPTATAPGCKTDYTCRPYDLKNPKIGYCIPDRLAKDNLKDDSCYYSDPSLQSYHGCIPPLECIDLKCRDAVAKTKALNESCTNQEEPCLDGLICLKHKTTNDNICMKQCNPYISGQCLDNYVCQSLNEDKFYWTGGCERIRAKKRVRGEQCECDDEKADCFDKCQDILYCFQYGSTNYSMCTESCTWDTDCLTDEYCSQSFSSYHRCLKTQKNTQDNDLPCQQDDPRLDSYNDCKSGHSCVNNICRINCDPTATDTGCDSEHTCTVLSASDPKKGYCKPIRLMKCTWDSAATNNGDCPGNYSCFKFYNSNYGYPHCVKPCDPTSTSATTDCGQYYTCRPFDLNDPKDPKKGFCIPDRQNNFNQKGKSCHYSDPHLLSYHGCQPPYECYNNQCKEVTANRKELGEVCDFYGDYCKKDLVCVVNPNSTNQRICMTKCNPQLSGPCESNQNCYPFNNYKLYWTGGCY